MYTMYMCICVYIYIYIYNIHTYSETVRSYLFEKPAGFKRCSASSVQYSTVLVYDGTYIMLV